MASVNKMTILGNLGRDPEVRHTGTGDAVTNVSIATTDSWKDKSGEKQESTEWHRVIFFGKLAEIAGEYLKKGSQVYVEGSLRTRKWQDKDGRDIFTTEVIASSLKMLSNRDSKSSSAAPAAKAKVDSKPEPTPPAKSAKPATPAAPVKQVATADSTADQDDDDFF